MQVTSRKPTVEQVRAGGAYLTDGSRLFRVVDVGEPGEVWLEDCARPDAGSLPWRVQEVRSGMRLVRPEG